VTAASVPPEASALRPKLVEQLQALHAIKSAGLRMFGVMLPAVRRQRDEGSLPEVQDLLERMSNAFGRHEQETREHERRLRERLADLGSAPSRPRELGLGAAALARGRLGGVGGQNHGANARDAFVFEHLEIASWELLEQLAARAGDEQTVALARECRAQDDEMAGLIRRNFPNVLSLMLASEGLPPLRPPEDAGG
jgi:ferritin-like metal-binding protein YciE